MKFIKNLKLKSNEPVLITKLTYIIFKYIIIAFIISLGINLLFIIKLVSLPYTQKRLELLKRTTESIKKNLPETDIEIKPKNKDGNIDSNEPLMELKV
jgi:hypothetical protein